MLRSIAITSFVVWGLTVAQAAEWHHSPYLDGGDWWRGRIPVVVTNPLDVPADGDPVSLRIGTASGDAALVGQEAKAVRVTDAAGTEMLFAMTDPQGNQLLEGPIPAGSTLLIPIECPPRSEVTYFVYFDNPAAWLVPDFLDARVGVVNGDLEHGDGAAPTGWRHDEPDGQRRTLWTDEHAHSGNRCLKTVVDEGAEPSWISTRQGDIHIVGGAKYVMRAWVKAEKVQGFAGWYIHMGNREQPMMIAPMLNGGGGTFDWKEVVAEFTTPPEANRASLGTVLRGTGTAWFDSVTLECLEPGGLQAKPTEPERMELRELGRREPWPAVAEGVEDSPICLPPGQPAWNHRAVVRAFNLSDESLDGPLVGVELGMIDGRMRGRLNRGSLRVSHEGRFIPHLVDGNLMLFEVSVPERSAADYHVYFSDRPDVDPPPGSQYASLVYSDRNLVKNPSFQQGENIRAAWTAGQQGHDGVTWALDGAAAPGLGDRCAKMHVPHTAPKLWRGWHQNVAVKPGRTYLFAAWVKCDDLRGGLSLHAHRYTAEGALSQHEPMAGVGPAITGTTDWTLLSGLLTMPEDTVELRLHLTTDGTGTVWHDGVVLAECVPGRIAKLEGRPVANGDALCMWPVPAVEKVFPDEPAPTGEVAAGTFAAARNERESLQWAVRSPQSLKNVRVEVEPPVGPGGAKLADLVVNLVGYVPIDHPTSYYSSRTPEWHRKIPGQSGQCDGWPGLWPDPLLPRQTFDLQANTTQAVWVTVSVGKDAPAGDYQGAIRLIHGGNSIAELPFQFRVWDFTLPDERHVGAIYDVRLGRTEGNWGKPLDELYPEIVQFLAERRLGPDVIRPAPRFRYEAGRVEADFTEFDKVATWYFDELKLPFAYTPWDFYLFGWGLPPKNVFGERPYPGEPPYEDADRSQLRPEYKAAYQACLKVFWDHLKERGWDKKVVLYISDEPFDRHEHIREQMKALCDMIHEVDPDISIYSSTWRHIPEWDGYLNVWGIGHYGGVPVEKMAELREMGTRIWFTTDGQMCTDTPYCAVERLLPHYCFKYGAEAYEFWGATWLTYDPYQYGWHAYIHQSDEPGRSYWVRYPNGDGFLIYPGKPIGYDGLVSSIRLEQAREGVEDYEYLHKLRHLIDRAKAAGRDVTAAQAAMEQAAALVDIPNAGGRYSSKILPDPQRLYSIRIGLAEAIEKLQTDAHAE
ncbi:MAG: DUF4091 domain-containing protein [Thermoguttaceae bacterium]|jgi:hypothetical protein|nr:DUF4091 domain-containing protein [Thermoguttaceae bacterium]